MKAPTTDKSFSTSDGKHKTAKQWLQRRLRKLPSIQPSNEHGHGGLRDMATIQRPNTAPSSGNVEAGASIPAMPSVPINIQRNMHSSSVQPPLRPPRPNSGIMRDINAWLDASSTPSPPLMDGVSYWRVATAANVKDTAGIQHATPIVPEREAGRPSTSHRHQARSCRRRAKRIQVQMPLLACTTFLRQGSREQVNKRSRSVPVITLPYEEMRKGTPPMLMTRKRHIVIPTVRIVPANSQGVPHTETPSDEPLLEHPRFRHGSASSARTSEAEDSTDRRVDALFGRSARSADSTRPSTAAAHIDREDSMGNLSDAPAYFTGHPPPSYHSRPASIFSTSSFGCIDGMNPAQRQISQQRAALQRGVKGRLKRFAQNFTASN
jgi:hypothetical protein